MASRKIHELKTWPPHFEAILKGRKTFEYRVNDRNYKEGDTLILKEWNHIKKEYTGRVVTARVSHMLENEFGLPQGYCILSLQEVTDVTL